ncbi:hypothetical protein NQZ68_008686 [Dissostichus eleginoides]|nr:hypothetical protein NQZ68_008686 [Dissostichus eleginoides]
MHSALPALLSCLLVLYAQGHPANRSNTCKCFKFAGKINKQQIQGEPVIHEPSNFCPRTEIIIFTANKDKCVNPQSRLGKLILTNKNRHGKNRAESTTASSHTSWSSAGL